MRIKEHVGRLRNMFYFNLKKTQVPINRIINIELTNRCNQQCFFCPVNNKNVLKPIVRQKVDMKIEDFENIIKRYGKYCHLVNISHHGESFVHPNFDDAILILKKYGIAYSLTTNGSLIGKHLEVLVQHPPEMILFSLYTINPEKFKKLTKTGDLKIVLKNIEKLLNLKKQGKINTRIIIRAIDMFGFEKDVNEVKEYFENKDVEFDIGTLNSWAGRVDIAKHGDISEHAINVRYCFQPWNNCIIGSDMGVYICNNHEDKPIDYLSDNKSLEDIWNSDKYREIRENILNDQIKKNEICVNCDYFCPDGLIDKPSPLFFTKKTFLYKLMYLFGLISAEDLMNTLIRLYNNGKSKKVVKKDR